MTRRSVMMRLGLGAGAAATAAGCRGTCSGERVAAGSRVALLVKRRLGFLKVPDEDIERFVLDFALEAPRAEQRLAEASTWRSVFGRDAGLRALEHRVCETFLLSTDFFRNGADESKPVRYLALYDPHRVACANPFARLGLD